MPKLLYYLLIIGLLTSLYLTYVHYSSNVYVCPIGNSCDRVLFSKYSQIFNIPISLIGAIYFLIVLIFLKLEIKKIVQILTFLGFSVGLILIYLQLFVLKATCFYCVIIDSILLISPIIFILNKTKLKKGRD